jgi:hypothetical protein
VLSANPQRFAFCRVYNGAAAVPFQALIAKILFRLQSKAFTFNVNQDLPRMPLENNIGEHLLGAKAI